MSQQEDQPGLKEFKHLLSNRERLNRLYRLEDFKELLLPYLEAELSNRTTELIFDKHTDYERGLLQGKAQALFAVINLPRELQDLKSMEELQEKRNKEMLESLEEQ
jgi:hypothetical protein